MAIRPGLRDELMQLSAEERLESWAKEIRRRIEGIHQGTVVGVPADQAFTEARARLAS